jgi:hypothetical protein
MLGAGDPAAAVLAGNQPALAVAGVTVGEVRRFSVDRDRAALFLPFQDAVVRDVAAQQIAPVAEPRRPFGPSQPGRQPLDRRQFQPVFFEARIHGMDRRIGIIRGGTPAGALV